jgi:hypothetical protein
MIDYDKLKQKVEYLETGLRDLRCRMNEVCNHLSMNEELSTSEPKYKVGDLVYFELQNDTCCKFVKSITVARKISYELESMVDEIFYEHELFPTRQALIEHQIEMWQKMKGEL